MIKNIGDFKDYTDGTIKSVYDVGNSKIIEISVLYNKIDMDVVCVPTHHFCNLGCKMCHLTNKNLNKKMIKIQIDDFINCLVDTLKKYRTKKDKLLISFMGVGEPLLNLELIEDVIKKEKIFKNIGYNGVSYALSTMMPNENLLEFTRIVLKYEVPFKVHFSLHTPLDNERKELIPSTKVSIDMAMKILTIYKESVSKNKKIIDNYKLYHRTSNPIEIHYTLIKNINDGNMELDELIKLLKKYLIPIKFIRFNPINKLEISNNENVWVKKIKEELPELRVKTYSPPGREIGSSCGEFTKHYYHYEIESTKELMEFNEWKNKHQIG